nr:hypothetical protein [Tanacetum cinerariifolium]
MYEPLEENTDVILEDESETVKQEMEKRMCGQDKENEEDALIDILKSLVGECKSIHTNKNIRVKAPSCGTNKVQGVSFVVEDKEGDILGALPCQLPPKELNPRSFTLPCTIDSFDVEIGYGITVDDSYSRRFDEYKEKFDSKIEQFLNEYDTMKGSRKKISGKVA